MRGFTLGIFLLTNFLVIPVWGDAPFIPNVKVSDDSGATSTINQGESCFSTYNGNIYAICNLAERSVVAMIPFAYSFTGGLTWGPNIPWEDTTVGIVWHTDPVIMTDESGGIHMQIQYSTYVIRHYLSQDGGQTWIDTSVVSDPGTGGDVDKPWAVHKNGTIYVTWQEFGGSSSGIRFARSTDNGASFQRLTVDSSTTGLTCINMDDAGVLYLIYVTWSSLYFRKSYNGGNNWTPREYLSDVQYQNGIGDRAPVPSLAAYGDSILFIVWADSRSGNWDILGMRSVDGGNTWTGPFVVNDSTAGGQCKPWAVFDPYGGLHVQWYHTPDWPTTTSSVWSVRYQYSSDSGITFEPSIRITDTTFQAHYYNDNTFMGDYHINRADSNYIYSIWTDGRDGNMNLYFSRAPLLTGIEEPDVYIPTISVRVPSFITQKGILEISTIHPRDVEVSAYDICGRQILTLFSGRVTKSRTISLSDYRLPRAIIFFRVKSGTFCRIYKSIHL